MTTFNTTACKVKVNGQWTPLLALGGSGGGGGLMVHFSGSGSSVTCDHTVAEIVAAAESGPVTGELDDNVFVLTQYGSSYATFIYSADFDYGGEDYYILSSNYGSSTWTLTEKFKADIYDIQDTEGNSLIGNDHIAVIPSGGGGDVEWATYGTTTNAQLETWYQAGKVVLCEYSGCIYILDMIPSSTHHIFNTVAGNGSASYFCKYVDCRNNSWSNGSHVLEVSDNKLQSTSSWSSSDTYFPTTKSVEQYVAGQSDIEWATYDTTTNAQVYAWAQAGKHVLCNYNSHVYCLTNSSATSAVFVYTGAWASGSSNPPTLYIMRLTNDVWSTGSRMLESSTRMIVSTDTWNSSDSYYHSTAAADGRFQRLSNAMKSTSTWTSNDVSYPTTAAVEQYVAGHGDVEWAEYDVTTSAQLNEWCQAGKLVLCKYSTYIYALTRSSSNTNHIFNSVSGNETYYCRHLYCNNNIWSQGSTTLETISNKLQSTSSWSSSDTYFPTTKSVEQYVAGHGDIEWAEYNSTTFAQILEWHNAGKLVALNYNGNIFIASSVANQTYTKQVKFVQSNVNTLNTPAYPSFGYITLDGITGTWSDITFNVSAESQDNKLKSTATWTGNDTKYPTTKAVENYVAAHAGGSDTFWAEYGVTTFSTLQAIYDDYENPKDVKLWYGPYLMQMSIVTSNEASFTSIDYSGGKYYVRHANVNSSNSWSYDYDELNVI